MGIKDVRYRGNREHLPGLGEKKMGKRAEPKKKRMKETDGDRRRDFCRGEVRPRICGLIRD